MPAAKKIRVDKFSPALFQSNVVGTVDVTQGGTGQTSASAAINALLPSQTTNSGKYLGTDGNNVSWSTVSGGGGGGGTVTTVTAVQITDSGYNVLDDTAVSTTGGFIKITGTNFVSGASVIIGSTQATSVGFVSSTTLNVQVPALTAGTYIVYVVNPDGSTAIRVNGLTASDLPNWQTASALGEYSVDAALSIQLLATEATSYVLQVGSSLPPGLSLSSGGLLSGTVTGLTVDTLYTFTVVAIDPQSQDSPRTFTVTIGITDPFFIYNSLLLRSDVAAQSFSTDASTNNFYAAIFGDTKSSKFTPYLTGWSNYFDGSGDYIYSSGTMPSGTENFCIEGWFYVDGGLSYLVSGGSAYAARFVSGVGTGALEIVIGSASGSTTVPSTLNVVAYGAAASFNFAVTGLSIPVNIWHHLAVVRQGSLTAMYLNGVRVGSYTNSYSFAANNNIRIGGAGDAAAGYLDYFKGYLSNIRIVKGSTVYDPTQTTLTVPTAPLTAITNTSLLTCQSNRFIDNSTNNFTITRNGDITVTSFNPFNLYNTGTDGSAVFDGTGDYLEIAATSNLQLTTGNFTVEAWIYPISFNGPQYSCPIFSYGDDSLTFRCMPTANTSTSLNIYAVNAAGSPMLGTSGTSGGSVLLNQWTHVAMTRNSTTYTLWVNGASVATVTSADTIRTNSTVWIGRSSAGTSPWWNGYISNLRVIKGTALYTANFTPPTSLLTAIANTSLLTCQYSQSSNNNTFLDTSYYNNIVTRNGNTTTSTFTPFYNNYSVYFDGTGDYLTLPVNSAFDLGTNACCVEAWVYPLSTSTIGLFCTTNGASGQTRPNFTISTTAFQIDFFANVFFSGSATIPLNSWSHVVFTRASTNGAWRFFVNGVLTGYNATGTQNLLQTTVAQAVGLYSGSSSNALISNLRITNGSVPTTYETSSIITGTSIFIPPTSPLTAITNTVLLTCQSNRFLDNSTNNFTITPAGNTAISKFSCFTLDQYYSVAQYGGSMYFDGTGDFLSLTTSPAFTYGTGDFTLEAWVYTTVNAVQGIIGHGDGAGARPYLYINGLTPTIFFNSTGVATGPNVTLNMWNHIACSRSGTTLRVYTNGVAGTSATNSTSLSNTLLYIGAATGSTQLFTGYICNVRIVKGTAVYTTNFTPPTTPVITSVEQTSLLITGSAAGVYDITGNNVVETVANASASTAQTKFLTASMYFDGTGDYLTLPAVQALDISTGNFTIEAWVRLNVMPTTDTLSTWQNWMVIYARGSVSATDGWQFQIGQSLLMFSDSYGTAVCSGTHGMVINTWYYLTVTRSGTTFRVFVNGVQVGTSTSSITLNSGPKYWVGTETGEGAYLNGYIEDLRITRGIARYTSNFTPPTQPSRRR